MNGKDLKMLLLESGVSRQELADYLDVSLATVWKHCNSQKLSKVTEMCLLKTFEVINENK